MRADRQRPAGLCEVHRCGGAKCNGRKRARGPSGGSGCRGGPAAALGVWSGGPPEQTPAKREAPSRPTEEPKHGCVEVGVPQLQGQGGWQGVVRGRVEGSQAWVPQPLGHSRDSGFASA